MPKLYCQSCKKVTHHKSVMRRNVDESISITKKCTEFIGQIVTGKQYYKMEPQHYCRTCNCQNYVVDSSNTGSVANQPSHIDVQIS